MVYKLQYREKGQKRYYDFSSRRLEDTEDARQMKSRAEKNYPDRVFRIRSGAYRGGSRGTRRNTTTETSPQPTHLQYLFWSLKSKKKKR